MKKNISFLFLFLMTFSVFGQKNILIIPFDTKMYNNQESKQICEYSGVSYSNSIEKIRSNLDMHLYSALKDSTNVASLLLTYTTDAASDLEIVHNNSEYFFSEKTDEVINKPRKNSEIPQNIVAGEVVSVATETKDQLVNVKLQDPQLFSDLVQDYKAQYIVYLTQFELLGDYSNPYTVADNSYLRTIRVHYVIYNSLGKFVYGNIATTTFSAKVNDIDQICDIYLKRVATLIARHIP